MITCEAFRESVPVMVYIVRIKIIIRVTIKAHNPENVDD